MIILKHEKGHVLSLVEEGGEVRLQLETKAKAAQRYARTDYFPIVYVAIDGFLPTDFVTAGDIVSKFIMQSTDNDGLMRGQFEPITDDSYALAYEFLKETPYGETVEDPGERTL